MRHTPWGYYRHSQILRAWKEIARFTYQGTDTITLLPHHERTSHDAHDGKNRAGARANAIVRELTAWRAGRRRGSGRRPSGRARGALPLITFTAATKIRNAKKTRRFSIAHDTRADDIAIVKRFPAVFELPGSTVDPQLITTLSVALLEVDHPL